jgi:L-fuconolactonase
MIVDAHQHFWRLERGDYGWLTPSAGVLYRDYLPSDLLPVLREEGISATVLVQAAATEAETRYLFELAEAHAFVAGVIGWVDFERADVAGRIAALSTAGRGRLKGFRPMVQDISDSRWLSRPGLDAAFEAMVEHHLVFEALVRPVHLPALRERLLRHPDLAAVIDHAAKPDFRGGFAIWADELERLARETSACCKLSGLLTEAGHGAGERQLQPYVEHVFHCFGAERVLWGSDWPVLNGTASYADWLRLARKLVEQVAPGRGGEVFATSAQRLYGLSLQ